MAKQKEAYLYISAMLRARETRMLSRDKAERMLDAASFEDAAKILTDCGYEDMSSMNAKQIENALSAHRDKLFGELAVTYKHYFVSRIGLSIKAFKTLFKKSGIFPCVHGHKDAVRLKNDIIIHTAPPFRATKFKRLH